MMRGDTRVTEPVGEFARNALGHAARIDEDERGAVAFDELSQLVIDLVPNLGRHHGFEWGGWNFKLEVTRAKMPTIHNQRTLAARRRTRQEIGNLLDWLLRG